MADLSLPYETTGPTGLEESWRPYIGSVRVSLVALHEMSEALNSCLK